MTYPLRGRFFNPLAKAHYMDLQLHNLTHQPRCSLRWVYAI